MRAGGTSGGPQGRRPSRLDRAWVRRGLLGCGVLAPVLFLTLAALIGAARADYDPLRHPISGLSIGPEGWQQAANFVLSGSLLLAFALGTFLHLRSTPFSPVGPLMFGLVGVGLIGAGAFVTDPIAGYPPGTASVPVERTAHGIAHDLLGLPVFLGLPLTCGFFGRRFNRAGEGAWAQVSLLAGVSMFAFLVLARVAWSQAAGLEAFGGLFQRACIAIGFVWIALVALRYMREVHE